MLYASIEYQHNVLMLPNIKSVTYLFVYVQVIFSFYQEILRSFVSFSFVFSILTIAWFR